MGAGTSRAESELFLFGKPRDISETSQRPIFTKFGHEIRCPVDEYRKTFENFHFMGHLPPKSDMEIRSNRHLITGHGMHCREILFTPRCSSRAREFPRSVNFLFDVRLRSYGRQSCPIFGFWPIFFILNP